MGLFGGEVGGHHKRAGLVLVEQLEVGADVEGVEVKVDGLKAVKVLVVDNAVGVFVAVYAIAQFDHFVDRPSAVGYQLIHIGDRHVGVLFNEYVLVEEGGIHHIKHVGRDIAGGEIQLAADSCGVDKRIGPPRL